MSIPERPQLPDRAPTLEGGGGCVGSLALLIAVFSAIVLTLSACGPKAYPSSRPKYGDSTTPIGPDKSHFKAPPKTQPKFQ